MTDDEEVKRDFEILEESWTDYKLEDGTLVRIRPTLVFIYGDDETQGYRINTQIQTWAPPELRDSGQAESSKPPEVLEENIEEENLMHHLVEEGVSRYETPDGPLTIRIAVKGFHRSKFHDSEGNPQYLVSQEMSIDRPATPEEIAASESGAA